MSAAANLTMAEVAAKPRRFVKVDWDAQDAVLTLKMNIRPLQCYSLTAMNECLAVLKDVDMRPGQVKHLVLRSDVPGVFNFGGDLALFVLLARARDLESLRMYGRLCLDLLWWIELAAERDIHTIVVIEGDALGGGLESALPFHKVIAERTAQCGFPEVLFNLFPGMGAWNFVTRKASLAVANEMILSGSTYSGEQMHAMGLVDILAEPGQADAALKAAIRAVTPRLRGTLTALKARKHVAPIHRADLDAIVDDWARAALGLTDRDLRLMERLVRAQLKKVGGATDGLIEELKLMELEEAKAASLAAAA